MFGPPLRFKWPLPRRCAAWKARRRPRQRWRSAVAQCGGEMPGKTWKKWQFHHEKWEKQHKISTWFHHSQWRKKWMKNGSFTMTKFGLKSVVWRIGPGSTIKTFVDTGDRWYYNREVIKRMGEQSSLPSFTPSKSLIHLCHGQTRWTIFPLNLVKGFSPFIWGYYNLSSGYEHSVGNIQMDISLGYYWEVWWGNYGWYYGQSYDKG